MKRLVFLLLAALLLCGCGLIKIKGDDCDFLKNAKWEGNDAQCVNVIRFKQDGGFSNWCYCGSPVGDGDIIENFSYHKNGKKIKLYDSLGRVEETGKILYVDRWYLIVDLWGGVYVYENMDESRPEVALEAIELTGVEEITKPFLTILDFDGKMFKVSSHDYDKDAASDFETWKFAAAEDIQFTSVTVKFENGVCSVENHTLTQEETETVGDSYTTGFFEIDYDGKVKSVVFYGELTID